MKRIQKLLFLLVCLAMLPLAGFLADPAPVSACSCAAPSSVAQQVEDELRRKTAIFAGKVTAITPPSRKPIQSSADPIKISFEVSTVWKGEVKQHTLVYTAMSSESCGYTNFQVGESYIVAASMDSGRLQTGICNLTRPLAGAEEVLIALGAGAAPVPGGVQTGDDLGSKFMLSPLSLALVMATLIIVGAVWISIQAQRSRKDD